MPSIILTEIIDFIIKIIHVMNYDATIYQNNNHDDNWYDYNSLVGANQRWGTFENIFRDPIIRFVWIKTCHNLFLIRKD